MLGTCLKVGVAALDIGTGPLAGLRVVEFAGIGPVQMCGMLLADMGAEVLRLDRSHQIDLGVRFEPEFDVMSRSRRSVGVDLKSDPGREVALRLIEEADILIEGFRPGVMERLGLGPDVCFERNLRLVYGRATGWGQDGPLSHAAGHDINFIALTGALHSIGRSAGSPAVPLGLVGDFGGGALYLALGVCAAFIESQRSGRGQVVDAAVIDGASSLMATYFGRHAAGLMSDERGTNIDDSGAPFYEVYECADGRYISIGAIEDRFFAELLERLGIPADDFADRHDARNWPAAKARLAQVFATRTREEWVDMLEGTDVCFAPVLAVSEAPAHPHHMARGTFVEVDGVVQPRPAPRFSRTPGAIQSAPSERGRDTWETLRGWGFSADELEALTSAGVVEGGSAAGTG